MVPLVSSHAKQTFLEDRILTVPDGKTKANALVVVGDACETVLTPTVCARSRVIMREVRPGVAVGGIVLSDRSLCKTSVGKSLKV